MAKKPEKKPESTEKHPIAKAFEEVQAKLQEQSRPKGYADLIEYAKNAETRIFPRGATISAFDTLAPYYGNAVDAQLQAAANYSASLQQANSPRVTIPSEYYDALKKQVNVVPSNMGSMYIPSKNILGIQSPVTEANQLADLSEESAVKNNFASKKQLMNYLSDESKNNFLNLFRDTLEHEAGHIADSSVTFSPKPPLRYNSPDAPNVGYMGGEKHLVTGLSKVQREQYGMTGKRFESPDEYKMFILNLAGSADPESEISGFSEEAKRALRPQIQNAKSVLEYQNQLNQYNKSGTIFKFLNSPPTPNPFAEDFFEKSAQLIPALAQSAQANNSLG